MLLSPLEEVAADAADPVLDAEPDAPAAEMMNSAPSGMSLLVEYDKCAAVMSNVWVSQTPSPAAKMKSAHAEERTVVPV